MLLAQLAVNQAQKDLEKAKLIAPFDGTVAALNISVGEEAGSGSSSSSSTAAIVLNTPNAIVLKLSVGESDLPNVKAGQNGTATFDAISGQVFPIVIDSVGTNPTTTQGVVTYEVRAHIIAGRSMLLVGSPQETLWRRTAQGQARLRPPQLALLSPNRPPAARYPRLKHWPPLPSMPPSPTRPPA